MFEHKSGVILNGDCLELMKQIPSASVDMILCDLPYGTTACSWDSVIPFEPLWTQYRRVIKERSAIVLTATQPFTSALVMSAIDIFKYEWVWNKSRRTDFVRAKLKPMGAHENILVFSKGSVANGAKSNMFYFPQGLIRVTKTVKNPGKDDRGFLGRKSENFGKNNKLHQPTYVQEFGGYPGTQLNIGSEHKTIHPTQKPVALFEYLIKTYTQPGEMVLDNCSGSGTTAIAAHNTGRRSICIERDSAYFYDSCARVWGAQNV